MLLPADTPTEHSRQCLTTSSDPLKQSPNSSSCIARIGSVEMTLRTRWMTLATCLDIELPLSRATVWRQRYTLKSPGFVAKGGYFQTSHQKWRRWHQGEARPFLPHPRNPWSAQESMYRPDVWSGGVTSWRLCSFGRTRRHPSSTVALWGTTVKCFYT